MFERNVCLCLTSRGQRSFSGDPPPNKHSLCAGRVNQALDIGSKPSELFNDVMFMVQG